MEWSEKGNPGSSSLLVLKNNLGSISVLLRAFQLGTGEEKKSPSRFILLLVARVRPGPLLLTVALEYPKIVHALLSCFKCS